MKLRLATICLALTTQASFGTAWGQERKVGVVVYVRVGISDSESAVLAGRLGAALERTHGVTPAAGSEVNRKLPKEIPVGCVVDSSCIHRLGRLLDVGELLLISAVKLSAEVELETTWADVKTGRTLVQNPLSIETAASDAKFTALAREILPTRSQTMQLDSASSSPNADGDPLLVTDRSSEDGIRHMTRGTWIAAAASGVAALGYLIVAPSARVHFKDLEQKETVTAGDQRKQRLLNVTADVFGTMALASAGLAIALYLRSDAVDPPVALHMTEDGWGVSWNGAF